MSKPLKTWFNKRYPNNSDVVKFFIENDDTFTYDVRYIESRGQLMDRCRAVDVDELYNKINCRHSIITDRIFNRKTDNDYNLLMFCDSFPDTFKVKVEKNKNGISRMICLEEDISDLKMNGQNSDYLDEIYCSDDEECDEEVSRIMSRDNDTRNVSAEAAVRQNRINSLGVAFNKLIESDSESSAYKSEESYESDGHYRQVMSKDIKKAIDYWRRKLVEYRQAITTGEEEIDKLTAELRLVEDSGGDTSVGL